MEARLVKRAERRQKGFGRAWAQVSRFVRANRAGVTIDQAQAAQTRWGNPATPTIGATMDAMVKATQANIAPPQSRVIWDRCGFTPEEQRIMETEMRRREAMDRATAIASAAQNVAPQAAQAAGQGEVKADVGLAEFFSGADSSGL